jgi:hypothetical protein
VAVDAVTGRKRRNVVFRRSGEEKNQVSERTVSLQRRTGRDKFLVRLGKPALEWSVFEPGNRLPASLSLPNMKKTKDFSRG